MPLETQAVGQYQPVTVVVREAGRKKGSIWNKFKEIGLP